MTAVSEPRLKPLPFDEAIGALGDRRRELLPSGHWAETWQDAHSVAFTVARSAGFDILGDLHDSLVEALRTGQTFEAWSKDITPKLQAKGWWGKQVVDGEEVQLGSPRRLRTIFDVNMRTSAAAGRWEQIQRLKDRRPWLRYVAVLDERTRASHRRFHGTVLPVDHPWWQTFYPPNGWRCRCTVMQLSDRDLKRYGYEPTETPPTPPMTPWRNPVTGDQVEVPAGVDPGWAYNVGIARHTALHALAKVDALPAPAGARAAAVIDRDQVASEFGAWVDRVHKEITAAEEAQKRGEKARIRLSGEAKAIGALSPRLVEELTALAQTEPDVVIPDAATVWIDDNALVHLLRTSKQKAVSASGLPKALQHADVRRLPEILQEPEAVYWERRTGAIIFVFRSITDVRPDDMAKAVVQVNMIRKERRETRVRNIVGSGGWEREFPANRFVRLEWK